MFINLATLTLYYSDKEPGDISATSLPPSPGMIAVVVDGVHTGWEPDPNAPPPPPQWGYFLTSMLTCGECAAWYNSVAAASPFHAAGITTAFNNANPDPAVCQAALDAAMAIVEPPEGLSEQWEGDGQTYFIPLRFRPL